MTRSHVQECGAGLFVAATVVLASACFNPGADPAGGATTGTGAGTGSGTNAGTGSGPGTTSRGTSGAGSTGGSGVASAGESTTGVGSSGTGDTGVPASCGSGPALQFEDPKSYPVTGTPLFMASGELLGSSGADLAVTDFQGHLDLLSWYPPGRGFQVDANIDLQEEGGLMAIGDLNADGQADLVAATRTRVLTWLSQGDGLVPTPAEQMVQGEPAWGVAVADFVGDASGDVVAQINDSMAGLHLEGFTGSGGTLMPLGISFAGGRETMRMIPADMDGDGRIDLVVPESDLDDLVDPDHLLVVLNRGDTSGNWAFEPNSVKTDSSPWGVDVADFDGDGNLDVVLAYVGSPQLDGNPDAVQLWMGDGTGKVSAGFKIPVADGLGMLDTGDLDCDGAVDVVVPTLAGQIYALLGDGAGGFADPVPLVDVGGSSTGVVVEDFDGDGLPDLAVVAGEAGAVQLYLGM